MADWWGRKVPIAVGCLLMILGGFIGTFANGYGSMSCYHRPVAARANQIQCMSEADSCLGLATVLHKWLHRYYWSKFATLNIEERSLLSITAFGILAHCVRNFSLPQSTTLDN
jgi:hypothetical protein